MGSDVAEPLRLRVAERAYRVCEYCLVHEDDLYHGCEVDHIISQKHGGRTAEENLAFACFHCNRHKGSDLGSIG
jgi:5-methylcytosine-specific restriction endonuclease McrA